MADEHTRETYMIRLRNPQDSHQYVDVKIITSISFTDPAEGNQQYVYRFNNHPNGDNKNFRKVHTQTVMGSDHFSTIDVERIDTWGTTNPQDNQQQTGFRMAGNANEPPTAFKCHDFKIENPHQPGIWVVMRRIDELAVISPQGGPSGNSSAIPLSNSDHDDPTGDWPQGEKHFRLTWPDDDETNPSHLNSDDDNTDINPPYRFDPFQNLVDVHWGHHHQTHGFALPPTIFYEQWTCLVSVGLNGLSAAFLAANPSYYADAPEGWGNYGDDLFFAGKLMCSGGQSLTCDPGQPLCPTSDPGYSFAAGCASGPFQVTVPTVGADLHPVVAATWVASFHACILSDGVPSERQQEGFGPLPPNGTITYQLVYVLGPDGGIISSSFVGGIIVPFKGTSDPTLG